MAAPSLTEFLNSVEWVGKDEALVNSIVAVLEANSIKGLVDFAKIDTSDLEWGPNATAGRKAFVKEAFLKAVLSNGSDANASSQGPASGVPEENMRLQIQQAMLNCIGKTAREPVAVDLAAKLAERGLATVFPSEAWPPMAAVRELATKLKAKEKQGETNPFIFADLRKHVSYILRLSARARACASAVAGSSPGFAQASKKSSSPSHSWFQKKKTREQRKNFNGGWTSICGCMRGTRTPWRA